MYKVFIDGKEGTTGLRIYERIAARGGIRLLTLGEELRKDAAARREMLHAADIAFLCLPDAAAREAVALAEGSGVRIIDASTAHRCASGWAYGLPELSKAHAAAVRGGARVAVPGCHASGFIALVYPLIAAGALGSDALLSCTSLTGYSGGGKPMIAEYEAERQAPSRQAPLRQTPSRLGSPRHYGLPQAHKHLPEMRAVTGLCTPPVFNPIVADYYAGMLVSVPLHMAQLTGIRNIATLQALYEAHYAGSRIIRVMPRGAETGFLAANALAGRDDMELYVAGNDERVTLYARYDNLGKGASGAAVQCMNIMLGLEEDAGLVV